jgi:ketosteroid isomerase-like protein
MYQVIAFALAFVICCAATSKANRIHSAQQFVNRSVLQVQSFEEIYAALVQAMGGEKALKRVRNIKAVANCTSPQRRYKTEIYSARQDRLRFKQSPEGGKVFIGFVNGTHAWASDPKTAEVSPLSKENAAMMRGHEFQMIPMVLRERYLNPVVEAVEDFAAKLCYKVRMTDELGKACHIFFDAKSKLMAGMIIANPTGDTGETVRIVFHEWQQIGDIKLPVKITATDKKGDFNLNFYEISLNRLDPKIFTVPQSIEAVNELLQLHEQQRAAHFNRDARQLVSSFADDFTNISAGKIERPSREQSLSRFQTYFDHSTFLEWDDIAPPVIKVSKDASMAYVIVYKRVRVKSLDEKGATQEVTTVFSWMATYEKQKGKWALAAIASTQKP